MDGLLILWCYTHRNACSENYGEYTCPGMHRIFHEYMADPDSVERGPEINCKTEYLAAWPVKLAIR